MSQLIRAVPDGFDEAAVANIDERLAAIEREHKVRIVLAVESGSRAWGFPSPDSDYDCRFIFIRRLNEYLSPWQRRDVVEVPLEGVLDINGWELGKALKLALKGNAVVIEWLQSPTVYGGDAAVKSDLLDFAISFADRDAIARHYLHLGERQRNTYFREGKEVELKKLFYALRPAAALRWLRVNGAAALAPMHFPTLIRECDPPREVLEISLDLIKQKAKTRELGAAPLPASISSFVDQEFETARATFDAGPRVLRAEAIEAADALFRRAVLAFAEASAPLPHPAKAA